MGWTLEGSYAETCSCELMCPCNLSFDHGATYDFCRATLAFHVRAGEIVFTRQIVKEKVGTGRWLAMYLGLFGTYRKNETIDLQFHRGGKVELISDLPVVPYDDESQ